MARLPDEVIQRLKREVSLLRLVESQGYRLQKQGKDYALCCPFHADKEPSCIISPKSNLFNCFGCGAAGSVIDWVMKTQGVSFRFACELLQKDVDAVATAGTKTLKQNTKTKLPSPVNENDDDHQVLRQVIDFYHHTLKESPEALAYLEERGLHDPELIERFKLGFANRSLGYRLPESVYKAGRLIRGQLKNIGIVRDTGHEHFNGSLVVPVFDQHGLITEVYGRKIRDDLRPGTPMHTYLPGPHQGVWNAEALKASKEVILCEALIDAMTFWVHGFRNVTASYGVNGFTADHLSAFKQNGIERVLIAYDRDDAGNAAAAELAKKLQAEGLDCFRIQFPKGMDANAYAREVTPAEKSLGLVIRSAQWLGDGDAPRRQQATGNRPQEEKAKTDFEAQLKTLAEQVRTLDQDQSAAKGESPESASSLAAIAEPAAAVKPAMPTDVKADVSEHETIISLGERRYRVRGFGKNLSYDQLKINLLVSQGENFHVDNLDIYSARHRALYIKQASLELSVSEDILKRDLGKVLLKLEELQEQQIQETLAPADKTPELSDAETQAAVELLKDPKLLERVLSDFHTVGIVGEETNTLVGYLAGVSRKLDKPLAVIIQSSSAAGKSSLMDAVLNLMPEEERVQYSAMTGQSLFYMGETNLQHKILAIAEEAGVEQASYALKLLQSEGEITIASTGKDDTTGNLVTREYRVQGPVMLFLTTTAIDIDEELLNRCLVLTVNETREQTEAIHARQRFEETLEGLLASETKKDLTTLHRNAQRLLRPLKVVNPYADQLTFLNDKTRTRRDHKKYLTLIRSIALLHQYQRPIQRATKNNEVIEYVEVTLDDIETANRLAHEVLGRTLDELPPQTRKLLQLIHGMVAEHCKVDGLKQSEYRFSRRDIRDYTQWSDGQLKIHCARLTELEYLLVHGGGRGRQITYELLFDGNADNNAAHLMGLLDPKTLRYDEKKLGVKAQKSGPSQAQVSPKSGASQTHEKHAHASDHAASSKTTVNNDKKARLVHHNSSSRNRNLVAQG